jgi:hypothetical protein
MLEANKDLFEKFKEIHNRYSLNQEKNQTEFNKEGEKVLIIVREWEDKLCRQSEAAGYGNYTVGLAEKFQAEIKKMFPLVDHIGLISTSHRPKEIFVLKKIILRS